MPRSKYPGQLDTSVEIPAVRDNVLEVGSDAINSLRSAIFQIERTLGVNPQGAVGNTVADRINKSLDGNGNILPDALDKANVLSGPITNEDVSPVAAISESKLRLNIATRVLQSQITQVAGQIDTIVSQLDELSTSFAVHINPNATNRHPATAISVAGSASAPNTVAASDLQTGNVQTALQELYDSHINFSGVATALGNASHTAQQIYFDNTNVPEFTDASDVQEAIEDVALLTSGGQQIHQDLFHSNGALRFGKITSPGESTGRVISADQEVTFGQNSGSSSGITTITFISPIDLGDDTLEISDIITISDVNDEDGNISGSYEIAGITLNGSNQVASVDVFHVFRADSTASTLATLTRNINTETNESGLLAVARESATLTSSQTVQIANPNAVRIVSTGIQPTAITTSNRFFNLSIDGGSAITFDAYNGDVIRQSIDSVVTRINEQCAEQALDVMAYRLDKEDGTSELAIIHNLPDEQTEVHTLKVTAGSDGGITALGLAGLDDVEVSGEFGSEYYISGVAYNGLASKLDSSLLNYFVSTNTVGNGNSNINFIEEGIKSGDLVTISGASSDDDNGTYVITSVNDTQLVLDSTQLPTGFADNSGENTRFRIFHNIISFSSITFQEVSGTFGAVVADVFIDDERKPFYKTRLEYNAEISGVDSVITVVDFVGDVTGKQVQISADTGTIGAIISIDGGNAVEVAGFDKYFWLKSGTENIFLKLYIADVGALLTKIGAGPAITIDVFGFQGVNQDSNLKIARVPYGNFKGRVIGGKKTSRVLSKVQKGNVGPLEISNEAKRALVYRPLDELRSNGVVRGLEILNATIDGDGFYNFDMEDGICYVGGRRFDLSGIDTFVTDIDSTAVDKLFVVIDEDGNLAVEQSISVGSDCFSPFGVGESAVLASLEYDGSVISIIDLRLFIDELDLKLLNSITVSPQRGLGHFTTVQKGLAYAKRFGQLFPSAGVPTVHLKSGTYEINVDIDSSSLTYLAWSFLLFFNPAVVLPQYYDAIIQQGLFINFPVNLTGEGESTVISARTNYTFSDVSYSFRGIILIPGNGFTQTTLGIDVFDSGFMSISNLKMENCRINPVDIRVIDGADEPLSFFIDIDRVVFDLTDFTPNPLDNVLAPSGFGITEDGDFTRPKGNVAIRNCKFLEAEITGPGNDDIQNILIMNNIYFGEEDGGLLTGNFYDFTTTADSQNVNIIGNIHANNLNPTDDPSGPNIVSGGNQRWGDRFSRDIYVGGEVNVNDRIIVENNAIANDFEFDSTKQTKQLYLWSNVTSLDDGDSGSGSLGSTISQGILLTSFGSNRWTFARIAGSDTVSMPLARIPAGCNIRGIRVAVGAGTHDWTLELDELNLLNNDLNTIFTNTLTNTGTTSPNEIDFLGINHVAVDDRLYYARISHDAGFFVACYYVTVLLEYTNISEILGAQ